MSELISKEDIYQKIKELQLLYNDPSFIENMIADHWSLDDWTETAFKAGTVWAISKLQPIIKELERQLAEKQRLIDYMETGVEGLHRKREEHEFSK